jgi:hypothetical protein
VSSLMGVVGVVLGLALFRLELGFGDWGSYGWSWGFREWF